MANVKQKQHPSFPRIMRDFIVKLPTFLLLQHYSKESSLPIITGKSSQFNNVKIYLN